MLASAGLDVSAPRRDRGAEVILTCDSHVLAVKVKAATTVRPGDIAALPRPSGEPMHLLVGERIPQAAREALNEARWSRLDLRATCGSASPAS